MWILIHIEGENTFLPPSFTYSSGPVVKGQKAPSASVCKLWTSPDKGFGFLIHKRLTHPQSDFITQPSGKISSPSSLLPLEIFKL